MKPIFLFICLVVMLFCLQVCLAHASVSERLAAASIDLNLGYRTDEIDWSIGRTRSGGSPNIFSELSWEDLEIWQLSLLGEIELTNDYFATANTIIKAEIGYGFIVSGDNQDSDYAGDNRTLEWSRSNNDAGDGDTFDAIGAVGLKFALLQGKLSVAPLAGFAFKRQKLTMSDGLQTISDDANHDLIPDVDPAFGPAPLGPITGLDSSYDAHWWGPWLGAEVAYNFSEKLSLSAGLEYHWVEYFARANWNLRTDFQHPKSFEHEADGTGVVINLAANYAIKENWDLQLSGRYQDYQTDSGKDRTFFSNNTVGWQKLNEVNWESHALMIGLSYRF